MREMTASEASRNFSAVLDAADRGETIVVTRAGRRVATISPAAHANGAALRRVFERGRRNPALDDEFGARVDAAREAAAAHVDTDPWHD